MMVTPRSTRNASSRPGRSQARFAFIILFTINVLNYADRYVLPAILPKARQDLGLTTIEEGLLGSSFLLVYGLTTLPLGVCADRGVRKNIIGLCVGVWSVATTLGGLSRNFWQLISARTVLGIGEAGYSPASLSLLGDFFTKAQRGRVLSYWSVGNLVGAAIGFMFGGLVADAFGWRWAFYMVGIPGLIAAYLAWHTFEPERGVFDRESDAIYRSVRHWWHFAQLLHQADLCFSHWFDSRQVYPELCAHNNHSDVSFPGGISVPRWRKNCCTRHASYARADERQNR